MQTDARTSYLRSDPASLPSAWAVTDPAMRSQPPTSPSKLNHGDSNDKAHIDKENSNRSANGNWQDMINMDAEYSNGQAH